MDGVRCWRPRRAVTPHSVRALLDAGADANGASADGNTPLMGAARAGHLAVVHLLLERSANVNATTGNGWTALMAAIEAKNLEVVAALLKSGADPNDRDL